jgi:hypothetical protein
VRLAGEPHAVNRGFPTERERRDVVVLQMPRAAADLAGGEAILAPAVVAEVHRAPHRRGDVARIGGLARLARPLDDAMPLRGPGEEEVQPGLEELLLRGARVRVGERVGGGRELREEALRDGEVEAPLVGVEGDDLGAARSGTRIFTLSEFKVNSPRVNWRTLPRRARAEGTPEPGLRGRATTPAAAPNAGSSPPSGSEAPGEAAARRRRPSHRCATARRTAEGPPRNSSA